MKNTAFMSYLVLTFMMMVVLPSAADSTVWALLRLDVNPDGYTMLSVPVCGDRRFDGELGQALADALDGDIGGVGDGTGDELYIMESDGSWRILYLDESDVWRESNGELSTYELPVGRGLFVARNSPAESQITFTGAVGNDGQFSITLLPGWNLIGLSEGKSLDVGTTFAAGAVGAATEEDADIIVFPVGTGAWRRAMYVQGWGAPYDGNWFDLSTFQILTNNIEPGVGFYYFRQNTGGSLQVDF